MMISQLFSDVKKAFAKNFDFKTAKCNTKIITKRVTTFESYKISLRTKTADKKRVEKQDEKQNNGDVFDERCPAILSPTLTDMNIVNRASNGSTSNTPKTEVTNTKSRQKLSAKKPTVNQPVKTCETGSRI